MLESVVALSEESLGSDLRELFRRSVEVMLSGLLEAEADDRSGSSAMSASPSKRRTALTTTAGA